MKFYQPITATMLALGLCLGAANVYAEEKPKVVKPLAVESTERLDCGRETRREIRAFLSRTIGKKINVCTTIGKISVYIGIDKLFIFEEEKNSSGKLTYFYTRTIPKIDDPSDAHGNGFYDHHSLRLVFAETFPNSAGFQCNPDSLDKLVGFVNNYYGNTNHCKYLAEKEPDKYREVADACASWFAIESSPFDLSNPKVRVKAEQKFCKYFTLAFAQYEKEQEALKKKEEQQQLDELR